MKGHPVTKGKNQLAGRIINIVGLVMGYRAFHSWNPTQVSGEGYVFYDKIIAGCQLIA